MINFIAACFHYRAQQRGREPTEEDMRTCMTNDQPGSPKISIMSFNGSFHGRTFGALRLVMQWSSFEIKFYLVQLHSFETNS